MLRSTTLAILAAIAWPAAAQPTPASLTVTPPAQQLFERDWVLMNWALKFFDSDHDVLLEPAEAQRAADEFRKLADTNSDGRITPEEYRSARETIMAR